MNRKEYMHPSQFVKALAVLAIVLAVGLALGFPISRYAQNQREDQDFRSIKPKVRLVQHNEGALNLKQQPSFVAGRFGKFFVLQEDEDLVTATSVKTKHHVINAYGVTPDGAKIVYETDEPTYRTVVEDLITGETRTLGEQYGADITRVSPAGNEAISISLRADENSSSYRGLLYSNLNTGEERLLIERDVAGNAIAWSEDGKKVFFYEEKAVDRPELDAQSFKMMGTVETIYFVPRTVSIDRGEISELSISDEVPHSFPKIDKIYTEQELASTPVYRDDRGVETFESAHASIDGYKTRTPNNTYEVSWDGDQKGVQIQSLRNGMVKNLPFDSDIEILGVMNNGLLIWRSLESGAAIQFINWTGGTTNLVANQAVSYNLPMKYPTVTQGGASYPYPGNCKTNGNSHSASSLSYAYDLSGSANSPVLAAAKGKVVESTNTVFCSRSSTCTTGSDPYKSGCAGSAWGNYIIIRHDDGKRTLYAHLRSSSSRVYINQEVCQGFYIADQGHTGNIQPVSTACGDHLHFQQMAANETNLKTITNSIYTNFSDVSSNPLNCIKYTSGSTQTSSCSVNGTFSLYATPSPITATRGSTVYYYVYAYTSNGFVGSVGLFALNLPGNQVLPGTGFYPQTINVTANYTWFGSTLKIVTNSLTPKGTHIITIEGRSSGKNARTSVQLNII